MHELAIVRSLLESAESEARERGAAAITGVCCRLGVLRQVDPQSLSEAFEIARAVTLAARAELNVRVVGMTLDCRHCGGRAELPTWGFECPGCGSTDVRLSGGDELELVSLDVEVPDENRCPEEEPLPKERSCG